MAETIQNSKFINLNFRATEFIYYEISCYSLYPLSAQVAAADFKAFDKISFDETMIWKILLCLPQ
jgi:hypothetical protein